MQVRWRIFWNVCRQLVLHALHRHGSAAAATAPNLRASRTQQRSVTPGALLAKQEEWVCHRLQAGESTARKKSKANIKAEYEQARSRKHLAEAAFQPLHVFRMRGILQPR